MLFCEATLPSMWNQASSANKN